MDWQIPHPGRALPLSLRAKLRSNLGSIFAASDVNRLRAPSRLGVSTRDYMVGDPLKSLSLSHLVRHDSFQTRTDLAPGRASACVVFHLSDSMTFSSQASNKGQLALTLAAIIEVLHEEWMHRFEVVYVRDENFSHGVEKLAPVLRRYQYRYFISDFFYEKSQAAVLEPNFATALHRHGLIKPCVMVVRDTLEWLENNPLTETNEELEPFGDEGGPKLFSGAQYAAHLRSQLRFLSDSVLSEVSGTTLIATSDTPFSAVATKLLTFLSVGRE